MNDLKADDKYSRAFEKHISPIGAWALAIGTTIGWGSFVVTGNAYLLQAGPLGSSLGILCGMAIMIMIARNYHYMMNIYPDSGGAYTYSKKIFGYDYGFLVAWFLVLVYASILWANATSLPLFANFFIGDVFKFGFHYRLFGYDIFFGEILLTAVAILLTGLLCIKRKKISQVLVIVMAIVFTVAISVCFIRSAHPADMGRINPYVLPNKNAIGQIIHIASISSWAFIGFESISHSSEEFKFEHKKAFTIFTVAIVMATALYIFVMLLSVTVYPSQYKSWFEYISDLNNLDGIEGLPAFYAAEHYMGRVGPYILISALFSLIATSLIGNMVALSRLLYVLAKDNVMPKRLAVLNNNRTPYRAILLIVFVSALIPFLGRSAIGWIVDVTTIGATIIYWFVSASAFKHARLHNDKVEIFTGAAGALFMTLFMAMLLIPNLTSGGNMAMESYFLFAVWSLFGFVYFRTLLVKKKDSRFGKSLVVWVVLLLLILISSMSWLGYSLKQTASDAINNIAGYYSNINGVQSISQEDMGIISSEIRAINISGTESIIEVMALCAFSLCMMMSNYSVMAKREMEKDRELNFARNIANTDSLTGTKSKHAYGVEESKIDADISDESIKEFAVVVLDVNGLKEINDTLGHKAGDEYICCASKLICDTYMHSPVFRIGGDEFVVILNGRDYIHRYTLLNEINTKIETNKKQGGVVIAIGMSDFDPETDRRVLDVFERADVLMYERKKALKAQ